MMLTVRGKAQSHRAEEALERQGMTTDLGKRFADARKSAGLTQVQAAEQSGFSVTGIQKWESGAGNPSVRVLMALADVHRVTVNELLDVPPALPAGYVLVDRPKVDRVLATTDSATIAKEFSVGNIASLDWNVVVPEGAELMSQEDASELARVVDAHVLQHAAAELRAAIRDRLKELGG